jgi:hypothetical protein
MIEIGKTTPGARSIQAVPFDFPMREMIRKFESKRLLSVRLYEFKYSSGRRRILRLRYRYDCWPMEFEYAWGDADAQLTIETLVERFDCHVEEKKTISFNYDSNKKNRPPKTKIVKRVKTS